MKKETKEIINDCLEAIMIILFFFFIGYFLVHIGETKDFIIEQEGIKEKRYEVLVQKRFMFPEVVFSSTDFEEAYKVYEMMKNKKNK